MSKPPLRIISLQASNVKRLTAVELQPDGRSLVIVGGRNGAGKSSLLDAITMALAGKKAQPSRPVRDGAEKAQVDLDLGEVHVRRTITPSGGGTLTLRGRDGTKFSSPQALLDKVVGDLTFDPLGFVRMAPAAQALVLRRLSGIDLDELDHQEQDLRTRRRDLKRKAQGLAAQVDLGELARLEAQELPAEDVDTEALLSELERRREVNLQNRTHREEIERTRTGIAQIGTEIANQEAKLQTLRQQLANAGRELEALQAVELTELEEDSLRAELATAAETNRAIARLRGLREAAAELEGAQANVDDLSASLGNLQTARQDALEAAELPVEGLGLEGGEVTYRGVPLAQASSAEQLRVSVAMGLASNPRLRVMLIRDGSLLDQDSLELIATMAEEREAQVWIERVGAGEECSVVIEAGAVQEDRLEDSKGNR